MLAFTIVWGLFGGVALGFGAQRVASHASLLEGRISPHNVVWLGLVLPLVGVVVMLAGPLVLLRNRRFNDVLDGATFGAACAASVVGAETLTNSADFLHFGLTAPGDALLWIPRLLTLGIALPVLAAGAVGGACGSFWQRYRAPMRDRTVLGPIGSPIVAAPLAAGAIVVANLSVFYLDQWATLAVTAALSAAALVVLRRTTLPVGAITIILGLDGVAMILMTNRNTPLDAQLAFSAVAIGAGLIGDVLLWRLRPSAARPLALGALVALLPMTYFALYFAVIGVRYGFGWSGNFLSGSVILCGAVGLLLSFVALPPEVDPA
jgi:hypothetical protein